MPTHLSPLRYPGGKRSLAPLLADVLVDNDLHDGIVAEPFAGGAGASLRLMFDELASRLLLNDIDHRIHAFWRATLNQTEEFATRIETATVTMRRWRACRKIYDGPLRGRKQIDLAFATFFLNRCNRSGILLNGGPIGGYKQEGTWKLNARYNAAELAERVRRLGEYRDRIRVSRLDARIFLETLPKGDKLPFVYLDPPYYKKGQRLYLNALEHDDHAALATLLSNDPPFYWAMTYDNVPAIRKLYRGHIKRPFELSYSAYSRGLGRELIIFDPRLKLSKSLFRDNHRPGHLHFCRTA